MKNKKLLALLLVAVLVLSACGSSEETDTTEDPASSQVEDTDDAADTQTGDDQETVDETDNTEDSETTEDTESTEEEVVNVEVDKEAPNNAQTALLENEASALERDSALVTLDQVHYTASVDDADQVGATKVHMTFTNNGTYPVVDYTVKANVGNLDVQFVNNEAVMPGASSSEFTQVVTDAASLGEFTPTFYSYSVRVSETEGYSIRYNVEANEYSVNELSSFQLSDVNEKVNAAQ